MKKREDVTKYLKSNLVFSFLISIANKCLIINIMRIFYFLLLITTLCFNKN
jgi:hypothetical protein